MEWIEMNDNKIPEGIHIVKTKTKFGWNVMKATLQYDSKGKPTWSVRNQLVTHYLK